MGGLSYILLLKDITNKNAIINPQITGQQCFKWAVLAKHEIVENKHRIGLNYTIHEDKYNFSNLF